MNRIVLLILLSVCIVPEGLAIEILRWERLPISARLIVGQERVILVDRNIRVGVPAEASEYLRVQSAGGALYVKADAAIAGTRLQLQDVETGELILLDIIAAPAIDGEAALEPIRIIDATPQSRLTAKREDRDDGSRAEHTGTPTPVVLTRYAAQSLYAPLRTIEPVAGIAAAPIRRELNVNTLFPSLPVRATALTAWRLGDYWVTAVKLTHTAAGSLDLDPRLLQGDFASATFQHRSLGSAGDSTDTTVLYLVTIGHGLAESLLPAIAPFDPADPAAHMPRPQFP